MTIVQVRAEIRRLARSNGPIVIGPWMSEVGFELLYWVPFLRWTVRQADIDPARLWIVSRGGCRSWYSGITTNYLDLYDERTPDVIRRMNAGRIRQQAIDARTVGLRRGQVTAKQYLFTAVEHELIESAAQRAGISSANVLHPSLMYRAFRPIWRRHGGIYGEWAQYTKVALLTPPASTVELPERFVAVKFYASQACRNDDDRRRDVQRIVNAILERSDVVLLHTGTAYDDHGEFPIQNHPRLRRVTFSAATNLDLQTEIVARSSGFFGTYGGFAYLAPFLGIPTTAFYSLQNFRNDHLTLMSTVAHRDLKTDFRVADIKHGIAAVRPSRRRAHAA